MSTPHSPHRATASERFWLWLSRISDLSQVVQLAWPAVAAAVAAFLLGRWAVAIGVAALGALLLALRAAHSFARRRLRTESTSARTARRLLLLAELGTHRLLNAPQDEGGEVLLEQRLHAWGERVIRTMDEAGCAESDKSHFRVLGTYLPQGLGGRTPEYARLREITAEKVRRLREIARRLEGLPPLETRPSAVVVVPANPTPAAIPPPADPPAQAEVVFVEEKPPYETIQNERAADGTPVTGTYFRIGLANRGVRPVRVQVIVSAIDPMPRDIVVGHPLARMGDACREFEIPPQTAEPMVFVDVVFEHWAVGSWRRWGFHFADAGAPNELPRGSYRVTLTVVGGSAPVQVDAFIEPNPLSSALMFSVGTPSKRAQQIRSALGDLDVL